MRFSVLLAALISVPAFAVDTIPNITWDIDTENPSAFNLTLVSGESVNWTPQYKLKKRVLTLTNTTRVAFQFRAAGSTNVPYEITGDVQSATNGKVRIIWPSSNVVAAGAYDYRILVAGVAAANLRGFGTLTVDAGFGVVTGQPPMYVNMVTTGTVAAMIAAAGGSGASPTDTVARAAITAETARAQGEEGRLGAAIAIVGSLATNASVDATNALAIARLAYSTATNAQAVAFSALLLAQGRVSGSDWSNMLAATSTTGTWHYAESAGAITVSNGLVRLSITADSLIFSQITNTAVVYVSATFTNSNGQYSGPTVGQALAQTLENTWSGGDWAWIDFSAFTSENEPMVWSGGQLPSTYVPQTESALGSFVLEWRPDTNTIVIPMSTLASENLLAVDSLAYTDIGPWVNGSATNGSAALATLGFYAGYPWAGAYTQYTNGQQGLVFAASIAAPSFRDAKLSGFRFLYRGYNIADSVDILIYDAGASTAWYTNTLNVDTSEVVHVYSVSGFQRAAAPGMTLQATVKTTAETTAGTWTALPRVEAQWVK